MVLYRVFPFNHNVSDHENLEKDKTYVNYSKL